MKTKRTILDSHAGGVVRVSIPAGQQWGAVPCSLLEDDRMALDSRAVAAWLATRPPGWQISIRHLQQALGLGHERWLRIAREMEAAGYFSRSKYQGGPGGTWVWEIKFCPIPSNSNPVVGLPDHGLPGVGQPDNKTLGEEQKKERTGRGARTHVDKSKENEAAPGDELRQIAGDLGLTKGQLGTVLRACKAQGVRLQDLYSTLCNSLQKNELRGGNAVSYFLACLAENPERDWTSKARREAQESELQAEQAAAAGQVAAARARLEAAGAGGVSVSSPRSGRAVTLRPDPHGWDSGLVEVLDPQGHRIGSAPLRNFVQALASTAALKGRGAL